MGYPDGIFYQYIQLATRVPCRFALSDKPLVLIFAAAYVLRYLFHVLFCVDGYRRHGCIVTEWQLAPHQADIVLTEVSVF
jgi:hypothetical protein